MVASAIVLLLHKKYQAASRAVVGYFTEEDPGHSIRRRYRGRTREEVMRKISGFTVTVSLFLVVACGEAIPPEDANSWLKKYRRAPQVDITGQWRSQDWGEGAIEQKGDHFIGMLGRYRVRGSVHGDTIRILFMIENDIWWTGILKPENNNSLMGSYSSKGAFVSQKFGRRFSLIRQVGQVKPREGEETPMGGEAVATAPVAPVQPQREEEPPAISTRKVGANSKCLLNQRVGVSPFEVRGESAPAWLRFSVTDGLVIRLVSDTVAKVVETDKIERLMAEQRRQTGSAFNRKEAVEIGKLQGATTLVSGEVSLLAQDMTIQAKCISVETGEVLAAARTTAKTNQIEAALNNVLASLAGEAPAVSTVTQDSVDHSSIASQAYYEGRVAAAGGDPSLGKALYSAVIDLMGKETALGKRAMAQDRRTVLASHLGMQLQAQRKRQEAAKTIGRLLGEGYLRSRSFELGTPTLHPRDNKLIQIPIKGRLEPNFAREAEKILRKLAGQVNPDGNGEFRFHLHGPEKNHIMTGWYKALYGYEAKAWQNLDISRGRLVAITFHDNKGAEIHRHEFSLFTTENCGHSLGGGSMDSSWRYGGDESRIGLCVKDFPGWKKEAFSGKAPDGNARTDITRVDVELSEQVIPKIHTIQVQVIKPR